VSSDATGPATAWAELIDDEAHEVMVVEAIETVENVDLSKMAMGGDDLVFSSSETVILGKRVKRNIFGKAVSEYLPVDVRRFRKALSVGINEIVEVECCKWIEHQDSTKVVLVLAGV
jgi:hypothetical protein